MVFHRAMLAAVILAIPLSVHAGPPQIAMLLAGSKADNGFMEAGYNGLMQVERDFGAKVSFIEGIKPKKDDLVAALRELASKGPDMVIAHGGQNNEAAEIVAAEFPDVRFVVVQGNVMGPNLSSYEVLQEESAWLAGAAAGLLTKTGVVGHISGIRVPPGLKGRGGFYNGLIHTKPDAKFLTIFAGDQDDNDLSARAAKAEMDQGADIIFTMLNAGRKGAINQMRASQTRQIGNVIDWTAVEPDVFVASAIADVGIPSVEAVKDLTDGKWKPGVIRKIGLETPKAVSLVLSPSVSPEIRAEMDRLRDEIVAGKIKVSVDYPGPEITVD